MEDAAARAVPVRQDRDKLMDEKLAQLRNSSRRIHAALTKLRDAPKALFGNLLAGFDDLMSSDDDEDKTKENKRPPPPQVSSSPAQRPAAAAAAAATVAKRRIRRVRSDDDDEDEDKEQRPAKRRRCNVQPPPPDKKRVRADPVTLAPEPKPEIKHAVPPAWESIEQLNDDQRTLAWLVARGCNAMIIGMGGTGKTFAVHTLLRMCMSGQMWLPSQLITEDVDLCAWIGGPAVLRIVVEYAYTAAELARTVMVLAPSGVAASLYAPHGRTIHRALGLKDGSADNERARRDMQQFEAAKLEMDADRIRYLLDRVQASATGYDDELERLLFDTQAGRMISAKLLVVDEVFMADPELFALLESTMRAVRRNQEFMGGCIIVVIGDPLQLPPVIKDIKSRSIASLEPIYVRWYDQFYFQNWKVNLRQSGDPVWMGILTKLRMGAVLSRQEIDLLLARVDCPEQQRPLLQKMVNHCQKNGFVAPLRIWPYNADVDKRNSEQISRVVGEKFRLDASFTIETYVESKHGSYEAFLRLDDLTQVPPATGLSKAKPHSIRLTARDASAIRKACSDLRARARNTGGVFKNNAPIRLRHNTDVTKNLANGARAILLMRVGVLGSTRKFLGGVYDLRDPKYQDACEMNLSRRAARPAAAVAAAAAAVAECEFHGRAALDRYDERVRAWQAAGRQGPKPAFAEGSEAELEACGCICSGLLVTVSPDTPQAKTHLLQLTMIPLTITLDRGIAVTIRMRFAAITLDFARTVDSSQGQTCTHASVGLAKCTRPGQAYTALSRVKSLENLVLEGPIKADMFTAGRKEFDDLFQVRDHIRSQRDEEKLRFCMHEHDLPRELKHHPMRDKWMHFQTHPTERMAMPTAVSDSDEHSTKRRRLT